MKKILSILMIAPLLATAQPGQRAPRESINQAAIAVAPTQIEALDIADTLHVGGEATFDCSVKAKDLTVTRNAKVKKLRARKIKSKDIETDHLHVFGDQEICGDLYVDGFISVSAIDILSGDGGGTTFGDITVDNIIVNNDAIIDGTVSSCDVIVGCNLFLNDSINPAIGNVIKNGNRFITTFPGTVANSTFMGENSGTFFTDPTSIQNTSFGNNTLNNNQFGFNNTAVGSFALELNGGGPVPLANNNTAVGAEALRTNGSLSGESGFNTAIGSLSMTTKNEGEENTAVGALSMLTSNIGNGNVAIGMQALASDPRPFANTAVGTRALFNYITPVLLEDGNNTALGFEAGINLTDGLHNLYIANPGVAVESDTIRIGGVQTRAFLAGVRAVATGINDALPVLIDSAGQLGTISSSRRFKNNIQNIGSISEGIMELRPVMFNYIADAQNQINYGLIAEEVAQIYPELVVYDQDGNPFSVKYHLLYALLLNEIQQNRSRLESHQQDLHTLDDKYSALVQQLLARIIALESQR